MTSSDQDCCSSVSLVGVVGSFSEDFSEHACRREDRSVEQATLVDRARAFLRAAHLRAALVALHARLADVGIDALDVLVLGGGGAGGGERQREDGETVQCGLLHGSSFLGTAVPSGGWALDIYVDASDPARGVELEQQCLGRGVAQALAVDRLGELDQSRRRPRSGGSARRRARSSGSFGITPARNST
jgi:hypothetical protein